MRYLQEYREWSPTQFDCKGLGSWDNDLLSIGLVAPVSINRDTPEHDIDASNFAVLERELERIDPDGVTWERHSFNHWGPGWFDIIVVHPTSLARAFCEECAAAMDDYPLLSEEDHSQREYDAINEYWEQMSFRDRIDALRDCGGSTFAARRDHPWDIDTSAGDWPYCLLY